MNKEEIMKKVIEKAGANGWREGADPSLYEFPDGVAMSFEWMIESGYYKSFTFSNLFAKAFWGEGDKGHFADQIDVKTYVYDGNETSQPRWQFHLQQMVLQEDPIKYLEQFI